ncbi:hypothetical protein ACP70R_014766 [Stipagrostis hirtigluma subsp. patula]
MAGGEKASAFSTVHMDRGGGHGSDGEYTSGGLSHEAAGSCRQRSMRDARWRRLDGGELRALVPRHAAVRFGVEICRRAVPTRRDPGTRRAGRSDGMRCHAGSAAGVLGRCGGVRPGSAAEIKQQTHSASAAMAWSGVRLELWTAALGGGYVRSGVGDGSCGRRC